MRLLIVESPSKAKTIEKYLGKDYRVVASVGHVRDLPKSNTKAVDITNMRGHIEENMRLVSLRDPLVSPDAARSIRSLATDKREFRPVSIRAKMLTDGIRLSDDFDRQFMMLASRTSLWLNGQRKNEE